MTNTEIKTVELIVNSQDAKRKLDELNGKLDLMKRKREDALDRGDSRALGVYTREVRKLENEIQRTETRAASMSRALSNLDRSTPNELRRTLRELQKELNSGKVQRGSREWETLTLAIRETKQALEQVNGELRTVQRSSFSDRLAEWGNKWMGLVMNIQAFFEVVSGIRMILQQAVSDYANIEEAMAQVRKYTGLSAGEVKGLNDELKAMDTRTSREQLNALAGDAGKLGITAKDQILEFVEAADKINVALGDDLGADAVKNVGKLAMLFGEDGRLGLKGAMLATASTVNELSQNSSASASYLEDFTARLAGVGKQAGLTQAQIMGFAAVLDANMQQDETSATAMSQLITKMYQEPAKFAALAGKDLSEFSRLLREDANGALLAFLANMRAQGGFESLAPMFEQMGLDGTRATAVLTSLADKLADVESMQRLANDAYADAVSIDREFSVQNSTVQAQLDKAKKAMVDMRAELGQKLMPLASKMVNFTTLFMRTLSSLISWIDKNKYAITTVTVAIAAYTVAVNASVIADKLKLLWTNHLKVALQRLYAVLLAHPWAAVAAVVAVFVGHLMDARRQADGLAETQKRLSDISGEAADSVRSEERELQRLLSVARDENRSKADREAAIRKLNEISPEYLGNLSLETVNTKEATAAMEKYVKVLRLKKQIELGEEELADLKKQQREAYGTSMNDGANFIEKAGNGVMLAYSDFTNFLANNGLYLGGLHSDFRQKWDNYGKNLADSFTPRINAVEENLNRLSEEFTKVSSGGGQTDYGVSAGIAPAATASGSGTGESEEDRLKKERQRIEDFADTQRVLRLTEYNDGIISRKQYDEKLIGIDRDMITKQRDLYEAGSREYNGLELKRLELARRVREQQQQDSIRDIERQEDEAEAAAQREFLNGTLSEEQLQKKLDEIKLSHLRKRAAYYAQTGDLDKERETTAQADEEDLRLQLARRKDYLQRAKALQEEYFKKSLDERQKDEERLLEELVSEGIISEEKKQKYLLEIQKKYDRLRKEEKQKADESEGKITNPLGNASGIASDFIDIVKKVESLQAKLKDGEETWEDYAAVAVASLAMVGSTLSSISQLFSAQQQAEENAVSRRYDTEIKKVGENSRKGKKLEEQKQRELAAVKNKYRKKQMAMEIAQAAASTAMAAINAYASASKISWILGPIAAAMALAAGGIQIAAIKKQHTAESTGYYSGGFTGGSDYRREAGVVHQGEFVASHLAVQNPNVLPFLRLIDHAQRNNTVASLSAADVSRAIAAPQATASAATVTASSPALQVVDTDSKATREVLQRLNESLEAGIHASVSITGDEGFERQWERYNKMKARK